MKRGRVIPTVAAAVLHAVLAVLMVLTIENYMDFFLVCAYVGLGLALVLAAAWCIRLRTYLPWHTVTVFIVCAALQVMLAEFTPLVSADGLGSGFALVFYYIALAVSCAAVCVMQALVWVLRAVFAK